MLYILHGTDDYTCEKELAEIKARLGDPELASLNTTVLEGQKLTPEQLRGVCEVFPFFLRQRLVVVEGLLKRFQSKKRTTDGRVAGGESGTGQDAARWQAFADCLSQAPASTVVVLIENEEMKTDNPLLRALRPGAEVQRFITPRGADLERWITGQVKSCGGQMQPGAVRLLAEIGGNNLRVLANEIEKLVAFGAGRAIDERDVRTLVSDARESTIFNLVDALAERKTPRALHVFHELLGDGAQPLYVLTMFTRQFRLLLQIKALRERGEPTETIRKVTGLFNEFALAKTERQSNRYTLVQLKLIYARLLQTDVEIKSGYLTPDTALDVLIVDLAGVRG
ncbi:MAG: DNA polymerase III subunit delta [Chloroflexota bacterium]|nr:MAG: DNA polymerase III subunit delta [Chloroflexota bacterium]